MFVPPMPDKTADQHIFTHLPTYRQNGIFIHAPIGVKQCDVRSECCRHKPAHTGLDHRPAQCALKIHQPAEAASAQHERRSFPPNVETRRVIERHFEWRQINPARRILCPAPKPIVIPLRIAKPIERDVQILRPDQGTVHPVRHLQTRRQAPDPRPRRFIRDKSKKPPRLYRGDRFHVENIT